MSRRSRTNQLPGGIAAQTVAHQPRTLLTHSTRTFSYDLMRAVHNHAGMRLHVGCGPRRLPGWINADAVAGVGDVVLDLHDANALPPNTYREIYGCHVLEHCWPQDTPAILRRLHAALLPGGTLRISVPDIRLVVKNCIDGHAYGEERSALSVIYGGTFSHHDAAPDLHRQTFWRERLARLLAEAGFVNVREWGRGQYPAIDALGDYATVPFDLSTGASLISLNMEADRAGTLESPRAVHVGVLDVSVLLGTVNRPDMLKACVESVRKSLDGMTYEIVVAYGHSDDPSLAWMRMQQDVVPVLGGMNGAIEAFNRAYATSRGRYVCQLNDDVLVDGDAITCAVQHLDADASASGVVFKFDRGDGKGYRHETLAGSLHPNQMLVRRETCEAVVEQLGGFWGDAEHRTDKTYGGDSAFGVVCRHLGLRLDSVDGVTCRDLLAPDALRARNQAAVASDHGQRWGAMFEPYMTTFATPVADAWPGCYIPRQGMAPRRSPPAAGRSLRVLALPIVVEHWPQSALRHALASIGPSIEFVHNGTMHHAADVLEAARAHKPDLVVAQIQTDGWRDFVRALRSVVGPACTMVSWNGDVRTDDTQPVMQWLAALAADFDISLFDNCTYARKLAADGLCAGYLSAGFESEIVWESDAHETKTGAVFIGTNYTSLDGGTRQHLFREIAGAVPLTLYGSGWHTANAHGPVDIACAAQIMRRTPVTITTSLYQNLERYTSNRLKYACAAGAVAAVHAFPDMAGLGLASGRNCLTWSTQGELIELLRDWTRPERARDRQDMREQARALAVERFTWDRGIEELLAIVRNYRAQKGQS